MDGSKGESIEGEIHTVSALGISSRVASREDDVSSTGQAHSQLTSNRDMGCYSNDALICRVYHRPDADPILDRRLMESYPFCPLSE